MLPNAHVCKIQPDRRACARDARQDSGAFGSFVEAHEDLTYADACCRMLPYAHVCKIQVHFGSYVEAHENLTYAAVCCRMLPYAHVCKIQVHFGSYVEAHENLTQGLKLQAGMLVA
jgi:hypothetical protein